MEDAVTPETPCWRMAALVASAALCLAISICYWLQPDWLAAVTLAPPWCWLLPGLVLVRLGFKRKQWRPSVAVLVLWLVYTIVFVEEARSLLRIGGSPTAEWIAALDDPGGPVAAGKRRVAYYAGAAWFPLRKIPKEAPLAEALRLSGVRYVVADDGDVRSYRDLAEAERAGLRVVFRAQVDDDGATVFEVGSREGG